MQVEELTGHDLEDYLLSLEPEGWDRSIAIIDRPAASYVSAPHTAGAGMHASSLTAHVCCQYINLLSNDLHGKYST